MTIPSYGTPKWKPLNLRQRPYLLRLGRMEANMLVRKVYQAYTPYRGWMPEVVAGVLREECEALKALPTFKKGNTTTAST